MQNFGLCFDVAEEVKNVKIVSFVMFLSRFQFIATDLARISRERTILFCFIA